MPEASTNNRKILSITCPDGAGIVAAVTGIQAGNGAFITEAAQFGDSGTSRFFQRIVFDPGPAISDVPSFTSAFAPVADQFEMEWSLHDQETAMRTVIAVSKIGHCLNDLLHWSQDHKSLVCGVGSRQVLFAAPI